MIADDRFGGVTLSDQSSSVGMKKLAPLPFQAGLDSSETAIDALLFPVATDTYLSNESNRGRVRIDTGIRCNPAFDFPGTLNVDKLYNGPCGQGTAILSEVPSKTIPAAGTLDLTADLNIPITEFRIYSDTSPLLKHVVRFGSPMTSNQVLNLSNEIERALDFDTDYTVTWRAPGSSFQQYPTGLGTVTFKLVARSPETDSGSNSWRSFWDGEGYSRVYYDAIVVSTTGDFSNLSQYWQHNLRVRSLNVGCLWNMFLRQSSCDVPQDQAFGSLTISGDFK